MEKCPNCGAAVRPGAKFCTSCGSRLIDSSATATPDTPAPAEETRVAVPAVQSESGTTTPGERETSDIFAGWGSSGSGWGTTEDDATTPADRFASWSTAYGTSNEAEAATDDADAGEIVAVESATIANETTSAIAIDEADSGIAGRPSDQSDTRQRATALVEELRELIWKIGEQAPATTGDTTDIRNALSAARGQVSDFSDLEGAIAAVRESPRDIDALRELGSHAARLEELLASHARLTSALDDAISKMQ